MAAIVLSGAPAPASAQARGVLYASVVDGNGVAVLDLAPDDFVLTIGETPLTVVSAEVDSEPMKVALMIDNGDVMAQASAETALREGLASFLDTLAPQHQVAVFTIARNARRLEDFTTDRERLKSVTGEIFADRGAGSRMIEGLFETWERRFDEEDSWPVFVLVLTDGAEISGYVSDEEYATFVNGLVGRGATLHAVLFSRSASTPGGGTQLQYGLNLTQNTGGAFETINSVTGLRNTLTEFATMLNTQYDQVSRRYRIVYEVPEDAGDGGISVRLNRPGVSLALFPNRRLQ